MLTEFGLAHVSNATGLGRDEPFSRKISSSDPGDDNGGKNRHFRIMLGDGGLQEAFTNARFLLVGDDATSVSTRTQNQQDRPLRASSPVSLDAILDLDDCLQANIIRVSPVAVDGLFEC